MENKCCQFYEFNDGEFRPVFRLTLKVILIGSLNYGKHDEIFRLKTFFKNPMFLNYFGYSRSFLLLFCMIVFINLCGYFIIQG